jgi:hypothetical protein
VSNPGTLDHQLLIASIGSIGKRMTALISVLYQAATIPSWDSLLRRTEIATFTINTIKMHLGKSVTIIAVTRVHERAT